MATIMIVEDDRQTNDAVAEYLKSFGYRMLSAYDGDEACYVKIKYTSILVSYMLHTQMVDYHCTEGYV